MQRPSHVSTRSLLEELLDRRILLLDGSMGALIYSPAPSHEDHPGQRLRTHPGAPKDCPQALALRQPQLVEKFHRAYLDAGADVIETDTFNGNRLALEEFQLGEHVREINRTAAELARRAADDYTRRDP